VPDPLANPAPLIRRVYAYVAYRVGDGPDAEDITSETFERALRYRGSFDAGRGDPVAWLVGIARRVVLDRALRPAPVTAPDDESTEGHEPDVVRNVDLVAALGGLAERDREIIALRFGADMSAREIAEVLELRTNTVEVALHRALARLRSELGADAGPVVGRPSGVARQPGDATAL
jgi:RNA polymerase sigma-70 factor (ECF subfamily)